MNIFKEHDNVNYDQENFKINSSMLKEIRTKIYRLYEKQIKLEHHVKIINKHHSGGTVPNSLFN